MRLVGYSPFVDFEEKKSSTKCSKNQRKKVLLKIRTAFTSQRGKRKFGNGRRRTENTEGSQVEKANIEPENDVGQDDDDGDGHDGHDGAGHSGHVWD